MTKTRKKLLAVLLPVGVLVLAGAIVLALWAHGKAGGGKALFDSARPGHRSNHPL